MAGIWGSKGYTSASRGSDFLRSVLQNGCGRYVQQLQRLTFRFCKKSRESKQTRDFIENHLVNFAKKNPGVVLYVTPESDLEPKICAEYLNGRSEFISLNELTEEEILDMCNDLKDRSGLEIVRRRKKIHTDFPSIQGEWTPFTNKRNYHIKWIPKSSVSVRDAWDFVASPWKGYYRKTELDKPANRPVLGFKERQDSPLGKWGPKLKPRY